MHAPPTMDPAAWGVYADWLTAQGEQAGERIAFALSLQRPTDTDFTRLLMIANAVHRPALPVKQARSQLLASYRWWLRQPMDSGSPFNPMPIAGLEHDGRVPTYGWNASGALVAAGSIPRWW